MIETENNDILSGEIIAEDKKDFALRPQTLDDFQGQKALKDNLRIFLKAAKARGESLDHVFLSGPPGLGKTTLAGIIAHEMGSEFKVTSAPALDKPKDLAGLLTTISPNTAFFTKQWITNGNVAEMYTVIAMTDKTRGARGATAFLVDKGTPGFSFGKKENKMGIRASSTYELVFEDCKIPASSILGKEGHGFLSAMKTFDMSRPGVAAQALGIAAGALEDAVDYARTREQFGKPVIANQGLRFLLV